ncbi:MAG: dihydroneopterin aldolase [Prevotellaceae bacterium]|jgi:dihydroneopterin aldolase|nr:dihydroneopterin aldolase [Prevotellaceae bacterium]
MITIELLDMRFYAHHGCFEEERQIGARFSVDLKIESPDSQSAVLSDRLEETLNYQSVYDIVKNEMGCPSHLLEHLAGRVIDRLKCVFPNTGKIVVAVSKLNPSLGGPVAASRVTLTSE